MQASKKMAVSKMPKVNWKHSYSYYELLFRQSDVGFLKNSAQPHQSADPTFQKCYFPRERNTPHLLIPAATVGKC